MDSSQVMGAVEECSSSESGWTTYMSPMDDDDHDVTSNDDSGDVYDDDDDNGDSGDGDDDNDSMASTGRSHRLHSHAHVDCGNGKNQTDHKKEDEEEHDDEVGHHSYARKFRERQRRGELKKEFIQGVKENEILICTSTKKTTAGSSEQNGKQGAKELVDINKQYMPMQVAM